MLEIHLTGKTTEKRQNFDFSTPPACAEHLHFTLKGETRRAPGPPADTSAQMAWEDTHYKVSEAVHGTPTDNPGPDQHSPLDRPTPTQGKKEKQRVWGALSAEEGRRGIPPGTVNKQAGPQKAAAAVHAQQPGAGNLVKVVVGGKLHRREGKSHFPREL
jgi:hypothetical protein